jgi:hypothetical protein
MKHQKGRDINWELIAFSVLVYLSASLLIYSFTLGRLHHRMKKNEFIKQHTAILNLDPTELAQQIFGILYDMAVVKRDQLDQFNYYSLVFFTISACGFTVSLRKAKNARRQQR